MIKLIKQAIGIYNYSNDEKEEFVPTFKSTYPENRPSEQEWFIEYRVSIAYGKDIRHFG